MVVAGGFGVGKTTAVGAISEITPLRTEAAMTSASVGIDDTTAVDGKTTTTVAMDFGRLTLGEGLVLYLFGTPGQDRFWFMWDELTRGAVGALVLVDTRRLADGFPAVDYFEQRKLPFLVGVNVFDPDHEHPLADVRAALALAGDVPVARCDARDRDSVRAMLIELTTHALTAPEPPRADGGLRSEASGASALGWPMTAPPGAVVRHPGSSGQPG